MGAIPHYVFVYLQTTARASEVPIDTLGWEFAVLSTEDYAIVEPPESGVYVRGMYLEGAGWDKKLSCLIEPKPMQLVCPMPTIHFKPVEQLKKKTKGRSNTGFVGVERDPFLNPYSFPCLPLNSRYI